MIMIASRISSTLATSMAGALVISNYQLSWTDFHIFLFFFGGVVPKMLREGGSWCIVFCYQIHSHGSPLEYMRSKA